MVFSALALELAVRALGVAPEVAFVGRGRYRLSTNPRLGYETVPRVAHRGAERDMLDYEGESNALGFRDRDHALARTPGVLRIAVLGDSVAAGLRVARTEDVYPAQLERALQALGVSVEVMTFAVSGYNTQQEVETFKAKAAPYQPDLVIVAYCLNDRTSQDDGAILRRLREMAEGKSGFGLADHPLLAKSALYRFAGDRLSRAKLPADQVQGDTAEDSLKELGQLAGAGGFEVLVVVFPAIVFPRPYLARAEHEWVRKVALANDLRFLDLLKAFKECSDSGRKLAMDTVHPSPEGHRCAAEATARFLKDALPAWRRSGNMPRAPSP